MGQSASTHRPIVYSADKRLPVNTAIIEVAVPRRGVISPQRYDSPFMYRSVACHTDNNGDCCFVNTVQLVTLTFDLAFRSAIRRAKP